MSRAVNLDLLRQRIRQLEQPAWHGVLPFGLAMIDGVLPGGGLAQGAMHEILGRGGDEEDGAAAAGFAAGILARLNPFNVIPGGRAALDPEPMNTASSVNATGPCSWVPGSPPLFGGRARAPVGWRIFDAPGAPRNDNRPNTNGTNETGPILWCLKRPDLYGPGLAAHGLDPVRLVLVAAPRDEEILWAVEEGLRSGRSLGLAVVVGEIGRLPMVAGRRLQLAAERSGVTALILRRWRNGNEAAAERERPSAAVTRWRVGALPSADLLGEPGIGRPRWRVELLRCRGGMTGVWDVEVADATGHVSLPAELADRPAALLGRDPGPLRRAG